MVSVPWLQMPIVRWAGALVRLLNVGLYYARVMRDHVQRGMTQEGLQGEYVAARAQVGDRKRVTETMWMALFYASLPAQRRDHLPQGVAIHSPVHLPKEKRRIRILRLPAQDQVTPQSAATRFAQ